MTIDTDHLISPPESRAADCLGDALSHLEHAFEAQCIGLDPHYRDAQKWNLRCDEVTAAAGESRLTDGADGPYSFDVAELEVTLKLKMRRGEELLVARMLESLAFYIKREVDLEI